MSSKPTVLILATSYAPETHANAHRLPDCPRTDYVELAKRVDSKIIDYGYYDSASSLLAAYRSFEKNLRLDFHLAALGHRLTKHYDVVMLMSERIAIPYMMLQKIRKKRSRAVYVSTHSSDRQAKLMRSLGLAAGLDVVVSNTHAQRDFLVHEMGIPDDRILYAPYACDQRYFTPGSQSGHYVFSAGGIKGRDYPTLFEAARGLPATVKVAAAGRAYGPNAAKMLPQAPENVELLASTNFVGMRELYRGACVVVVPLSAARKDAAGCSVALEAMCCRKPVVVTHTKGMEDYIVDESSGILVEPHDAAQMRAKILTLMENRSVAQRVAAAARAECETRLSLDTLVDGLEKSISMACGTEWRDS